MAENQYVRPNVEVPEGMRIIWCDWPDYLTAYLLLPQTWTVEHVETYFLARDAARNSAPKDETLTVFVLELASILGLVEAGFIQIHNVAGLPVNPLDWKLKETPATLLGWLRLNVARTIEATQQSPLPLYAALLRGSET